MPAVKTSGQQNLNRIEVQKSGKQKPVTNSAKGTSSKKKKK